MNSNIRKIGAIIVACSLGLVAQAQLVDDFSSGNLSAYTLSRVNDGNGSNNVSFSALTGQLLVSYGSTPNAYEQVLLLRDDYTLPVGYMLVADVLGTPAGWDRDIGIAVGFTETPASLAFGSSGDVRSSYVEVSIRSNNQVVSYARDGTANLQSGQEFAGTSYYNALLGNNSSFTAYPVSLFIARLGTTQFQVGWMQGGIMHALTANNSAIMGTGYYTVTNNTPGAAVGFYADVRTAITAAPAGLDNLRIGLIPEPTTAAVCGLGGVLGLVVWIRRRK